MFRSLLLAGVLSVLAPRMVQAVPYASRVVVNQPSQFRALSAALPSAPTVSFVLNEPADWLGYRIDGGPLTLLDGSTSGFKSFDLPSAETPFTIVAKKSETVGYTMPTGDTTVAMPSGLSQPALTAGLRLVSDDANPLVMFNAARGVGVNTNPNSPNFGVAYVTNSTNGLAAGGTRFLNRGVYALNADGADAFGYGDYFSDPNALFAFGSGGFLRVAVGPDGGVYVATPSSLNGVVRLEGELYMGWPLLAPGGGLAPLEPGQNHGRVNGLHVEGSPYDGTLVVHTVDRDLTSSQFGGAATNDFNSLWRYPLGADAQWSSMEPTKVNQATVLPPAGTADLARGADGKFYLSSSLASGGTPGLVVLDDQGAKIYDSLAASRDLLGDPNIADVLRNVMGIAISPDQKWLAAMLRSGNVAMLPVIDGIPDLAGVMVVNTSLGALAGGDVAFDAAGNLHLIAAGGVADVGYRVISPGGTTYATTSWDGTTLGFSVSGVPEPATLGLAAVAFVGAIGAGRRRG